MTDIHQTIEQVFTENYGRAIAALISTLGDFDLAEDCLQDAFLIALKNWQRDGIPPNPGGWLTVTARNKAIDRLRRKDNLSSKLPILHHLEALQNKDEFEDIEMNPIPDERLKLIFTCCHPAIARIDQITLTLKTLGGLSTDEIASAFLTSSTTMAQRLVRVKRKIREANIPYRVPPAHLLAERMESVLMVVYLIFNEGYSATSGTSIIRHDLCDEAIRLARILVDLLEAEPYQADLPEAMGLLALMLLHHSRRDSRQSESGEIITMEEQDRSLWDAEYIQEGSAILDKALAMRKAGPYQIQAAISAIHAEASSFDKTDWSQIAALYAVLYRMTPNPVIQVNRAVAIAMDQSYEVGLALLDELANNKQLQDYIPYHAARADLLRRMGQYQAAIKLYRQAIQLSENASEKSYFQRRIDEISDIPE